MSVDRTLSDRMKLGREAAPWVIEEVEKLEERVPTWVPVEDSLPEKGKLVLCKCFEDYTQLCYYVDSKYWEGEGWSHHFKNVYEKFISVDAWMEIPE